jgi:hypothetical protein
MCYSQPDHADIDRQNLAATRLQGILEDLNMDAQQFATAIAILYGESIPRWRLFIIDLCSRIHTLSDTFQLPNLTLPASRSM